MADEGAVPDLVAVWDRALRGEDDALSTQHRAFLRLARPMGLIDDTALVAAPNEFVKNKLETDLRPVVVGWLSRELRRELRIAVTVDPALDLDASPRPDADQPVPAGRESCPSPRPSNGSA